MEKKNKLTRGQMAEARRKSAQAGVMISFEKFANPGVGFVFPKTGRKLTVSDELQRFGAYPLMGGVPASSYENQTPKRKPKKKK